MRDRIREMIAESGKMKVSEAVAYVMSRIPGVDKKEVTTQAKELIAEAKRYR
jgi:hypothetical protein